MKLIHEAPTKLILQEKCCAINAYETYILYAGLNQIPACWLKKGLYFLSILYAFWFFDDRQPWNIDHVGYPATDKNKKHFLCWILIAAYPTRLPLKKVKRRGKKQCFLCLIYSCCYQALQRKSQTWRRTCRTADSEMG